MINCVCVYQFACISMFRELQNAFFAYMLSWSRPQTTNTRTVVSIDSIRPITVSPASCHNATALFSETTATLQGQCPTCPYLVGQRQKVRGEWKCVRQNNAGSFCEIHWMASALSTSEHVVVVTDGLFSLFPLPSSSPLRLSTREKVKVGMNKVEVEVGSHDVKQ